MLGLNKKLFDTRRSRRKAVPQTTFSSVQLAMAYYLTQSQDVVLVQVGACDGVHGDPIRPFLEKTSIRAILVEPLDSNFQKLEKLYGESANVSLVQAAISHEDGDSTFYRGKEAGRWVGSEWVGQVASFDKKHLHRHGLRPEEIEAVVVPSMTISTLCNRFGLQKIDFLQVDAEGFDAEVVKMALDVSPVPSVINFERMHLTTDAIKDLFRCLKDHGYQWTHDTYDTLALHNRFVEKMQCGSQV